MGFYPTYRQQCRYTIFDWYPKVYYAPKKGEELIDPRKKLEPVCYNKCRFWSVEYVACVDRYRAKPEKIGDCEPQYAGLAHCVDRCIMMSEIAKTKCCDTNFQHAPIKTDSHQVIESKRFDKPELKFTNGGRCHSLEPLSVSRIPRRKKIYCHRLARRIACTSENNTSFASQRFCGSYDRTPSLNFSHQKIPTRCCSNTLPQITFKLSTESSAARSRTQSTNESSRNRTQSTNESSRNRTQSTNQSSRNRTHSTNQSARSRTQSTNQSARSRTQLTNKSGFESNRRENDSSSENENRICQEGNRIPQLLRQLNSNLINEKSISSVVLSQFDTATDFKKVSEDLKISNNFENFKTENIPENFMELKNKTTSELTDFTSSSDLNLSKQIRDHTDNKLFFNQSFCNHSDIEINKIQISSKTSNENDEKIPNQSLKTELTSQTNNISEFLKTETNKLNNSLDIWKIENDKMNIHDETSSSTIGSENLRPVYIEYEELPMPPHNLKIENLKNSIIKNLESKDEEWKILTLLPRAACIAQKFVAETANSALIELSHSYNLYVLRILCIQEGRELKNSPVNEIKSNLLKLCLNQLVESTNEKNGIESSNIRIYTESANYDVNAGSANKRTDTESSFEKIQAESFNQSLKFDHCDEKDKEIVEDTIADFIDSHKRLPLNHSSQSHINLFDSHTDVKSLLLQLNFFLNEKNIATRKSAKEAIRILCRGFSANYKKENFDPSFNVPEEMKENEFIAWISLALNDQEKANKIVQNIRAQLNSSSHFHI